MAGMNNPTSNGTSANTVIVPRRLTPEQEYQESVKLFRALIISILFGVAFLAAIAIVLLFLLA